MKLEISLFKFDRHTDYLPYYKKYFLKIKNEKNLSDILESLNKQEKFAFKNEQDFIVSLNGLYTTLALSIEDIEKDFSRDLMIEPCSIYRSCNDLIINENSFIEQLDIFKEFKTKDIVNLYTSYKIYFYASNTFNFEKEYIGDAIILLAYDLILQDTKNEYKILQILEECDIGVTYHTSLHNRIYNLPSHIEKNINIIKEKLKLSKSISSQVYGSTKNTLLDFGTFLQNDEIVHNFKIFNIAYFQGVNSCVETQTLLNSLEARLITLDSKENDLAMDTFHLNPNLTYKLAGNVMLEAFDKNADLLIVDDDAIFYLMDYNRSALSKVSKRDILIPVIHKNELKQLVLGLHSKVINTLEKHIVNPELI